MENIELMHHGIKGQKWGVKNGPPYPLGGDSKTTPQKKKNKKTSQTFVQDHFQKSVRQITGGDAEKEMLLIGATFVSAYAAQQVLLRTQKSIEFNSCKNKRSIKTFDECPKLSKKTTPSENMKVTNPGYPTDGRTMNCTFCTAAMALREKGYDVRASKLPDGTYSDMVFKKAFNSKEIRMPRKQTPTTMLKQLSDNGEGSYGNLTVSWKLGGRHSVFWKVENGKTRIYDGQSGKEITKSDSSFRKFTNNVLRNNIKYNRLDNCTPTEYALGMVEANK